MRAPSVVLVLSLSAACGRSGLGDEQPATMPGPTMMPGPTVEPPCTASTCGRGLALGLVHGCALVDGAAWCWGANGESQLGFPADTGQEHEPRAVPTGLRFTQIVAAEFHTCGLTSGGAVWCWGGGRHGQLGDGVLHHPAAFSSSTPTRIDGLPPAAALEVGEVKTCAVTASNERWCWGGWTHAQPVTRVDPPSFDAFLFIHGCVARDGNVSCWGGNTVGQLGVQRPDESDVLIDVPGAPREVTQVATPMLGTCALTTAGRVSCWGSWGGREYVPPREVEGLGDVTTLRFGFIAVCSLTRAGKVACMNAGAAMEPVPFSFDDVEDFNAGAWQACVRRKNREVWCQTGGHGGSTVLERVATLPSR